MRKIILTISLIALFSGIFQNKSFAQKSSTRYYKNPIIFADYSDPDVIRVAHDYYMISSSFHFSPGIPILHSRDLLNWKIIGHVLPKLEFAQGYDMSGPFTLNDGVSKPVGDGQRYAGGVWAPSIRFHNGLFYVYFPTPNEGIYVSTAKNPEGPWSKPHQVIKGAGYEDPCPFWDDDGKAYLVYGKVGAGPLILHNLSPDGMKVLDDGKIIVEDKINLPVLEGPKFVKRNGYYYIFAPIGGVEIGPQAVLRSKNVWGPYEHRIVLERGKTNVQGPHQGAYFETPDGAGWFWHFNSTGAFGRINHLQPVKWVNDWPIMGEPIEGKNSGQPVKYFNVPNTDDWTPNVKMQSSDEFDEAKLGLQWQWNHNPNNTLWSLEERKGFIRLKAGTAEYLVTARNTLTQILQGPYTQIETKIDISAMKNKQRAGLVIFGVKPPWIGIFNDNGSNRIAFSAAGLEIIGEEIKSNNIYLTANVASDQTVKFSYSLDGKNYRNFGETSKLARFSWWKGSRPALFTYSKDFDSTNKSLGYVDIDWFRVSHLPKENRK